MAEALATNTTVVPSPRGENHLENAQAATKRITRNTTYLTVAFILQKVLSFSWFIYYARQIGYAETGKYTFAVSFVTVFSILVDFAISPILIRETARARDRAQEFFSTILAIKLVTGLLALGIIAAVLVFRDVSPAMLRLVLIAALAMVVESFTLTVYGIFRGFQNLVYEAMGAVLYQVIVFSVGAVGLALFHSTLVLSAAFLAGALGNLLFGMISLWRILRIRFRIGFNPRVFHFFRRLILPFLIAGAFTKLYAYLDIILLKYFKGDEAVGWYSAAYKLTYALQFIPIALNNSIFPAFSALFLSSRDALARTFERTVTYLAIVSVPISVGIGVLAGEIIAVALPRFTNAVVALQISSAGLFFIFFNFVLSSLLNACNLEWRATQNIGIVMGANLVLNLLLIPPYGHVGTSVSAVVSAILFTLLGLFWARRVIAIRTFHLTHTLGRVLLAAGIMGAFLAAVRSSVPVFVSIPAGALVYAAAVFALRLLTIGELREFLLTIRKRQIPTP